MEELGDGREEEVGDFLEAHRETRLASLLWGVCLSRAGDSVSSRRWAMVTFAWPSSRNF